MNAEAMASGARTGRAIVNGLSSVVTNRVFLLIAFGLLGYLAGRSSVVCP